jgi:hypothetical protein
MERLTHGVSARSRGAGCSTPVVDCVTHVLRIDVADDSIAPAMTSIEIEPLLRYVALAALKLGLRKRYLRESGHDPEAALVAAEELAIVDRIRVRLVRQGWWN